MDIGFHNWIAYLHEDLFVRYQINSSAGFPKRKDEFSSKAVCDDRMATYNMRRKFIIKRLMRNGITAPIIRFFHSMARIAFKIAIIGKNIGRAKNKILNSNIRFIHSQICDFIF